MMEDDKIIYERCHRCEQLNPVGWYCNNPGCDNRPDTLDDFLQFAWGLAGLAVVLAILFGLSVVL